MHTLCLLLLFFHINPITDKNLIKIACYEYFGHRGNMEDEILFYDNYIIGKFR